MDPGDPEIGPLTAYRLPLTAYCLPLTAYHVPLENFTNFATTSGASRKLCLRISLAYALTPANRKLET